MAFKTKEQIFGDNGVNGLQVPISVSNPPGTAAANRGVGFGEGVTSAIANRTAYELAKNDEDLNARLASLETTGLDSAYRGGLAATPGSGRVVTVDGGAVEAVEAPATGDEANAVLRARFGAGALGLDLVGASYGALLSRVPLAPSSNTVLPLSTAAVLNPAGAGTDIVEVTGPQQFAAAGLTDLLLGFDFLSIEGTASNDGLYAIVTVLTDFRVQVAPLNPALPGFPATTAAAITLHRAAARLEDGSLYLSPVAGSPSAAAVDAVADADGIFGSEDSLRASLGQTDGSTVPVFRVRRDGSTEVLFDNTNRSAAELRMLRSALRVETSTTRTDSESSPTVVVEAPGFFLDNLAPIPGASLHWPEYHLAPYDLAFSGPVPPNFVALPATVDFVVATNGIEFQAPASGVVNLLMLTEHLIRLTNTAGGAYDGYYHIAGRDASAGNGQAYLRNIDGTLPSFPVGTATLRVYVMDRYHAFGFAAHDVTYDVATAPHAEIFDVTTVFDIKHQFYGDTHVSGGLVVHRNTNPATAANPHGREAVFAVDTTARKVFSRDHRVTGDFAAQGGNVTLDASNLQLVNATSREVRAPVPTDDTGWAEAGGQIAQYASSAASAEVWFDFILPYDAAVVSANVVVTPAAARPVPGDRVGFNCELVTTAGGGSRIAFLPSTTVRDDGTTNTQTLTQLGSAIPGQLAHGVGPRVTLRLRVYAGNAVAGDRIEDAYLVVSSYRVQ